ncbi:glycoside hydrolase family 97 protein [Haloarcula amylovorans]|uniref:glycoside hydrolase family 97 protein n=1 Tax=Haloarcula amylovorans TaxID=2562280 RepID=UPI001FD869BB|nr:glycoside hydrolase family 97 protein [Halomicroarcula amylolytica]
MAPDLEEIAELIDTSLSRRKLLAATGAVAASVTPTIATANTSPVENEQTDSSQRIESPDGRLQVHFSLREGTPTYAVSYDGQSLVDRSALGFEFEDMAPLGDDLVVTGVRQRSTDTTWEPVWGTTESVRNHYNELAVGVAERGDPGRSLTLLFRAYDDGAAFRYVLPQQDALEDFTITNERTTFRFADDYTCWWIPDNYESYEDIYQETPLSGIEPTPEVGATVDGANTPLTMQVDDDLYMSLHEAALTDYAGMTATRVDDCPSVFESTLVPLPDGTKVKAETPHASPWRTLTIGETPGDLVESKLVLNLNDPSEIDDTSWITPSKYMGIWWEMHIGKATWAPGPDVGATTENAKRYIDFASEHGIENLLVEGWNVGWEGGFDQWSNPPYTFNFTESTEKYDLEEVVQYGEQQDPSVDVVIHNETGGGVENYENQLEDAYNYYEELGIPSAKLGYVSAEGMLIDGELYPHHSQVMVNHHEYVAEMAAEHEIMLNVHEPVKPTGKRRTWPNLMTREGVRGLEYENAGPQGNPLNHTLVVPFTRMLGGPVDYNQGIFDVKHSEYGGNTRVHNTRARQLALYLIMFSGQQMVADLPENYDDLDEFEFIENVPVAWDETTVVNGEIGQYATFARRKGEEWYIGSGTDETPRALEVPLDSLDDSRPYVATVYTDGADADFESNPTSVTTEEFIVSSADTLVASMINGGGQAVRLRPARGQEKRKLRQYKEPEYEYGSFIVPEETMASESTSALLEITNTGSIIGGEELQLYVDGESVETTFARVPARNEEQVEFPIQLREPGTYEIAVGRPSDDVITSRTLEVTPKSTELEWLKFDGFDVPETVERGTKIEVDGTVTNTGSDETIQILKLTVDADVIQAKKIDLQPGKSTDVSFEYTFEAPGEYSIAVDDIGPWTVTVSELE